MSRNTGARDTCPAMKRIRVLLVDDQASIRRGLRMRLGLESDMEVVGEAADGVQAIEAAEAASPDVVLMDVEMPLRDGISASRELTARGGAYRVIVLTIHDSPAVRAAARDAGAFAFLAKHEAGDRLLSTIRAAYEAGRDEEDTS